MYAGSCGFEDSDGNLWLGEEEEGVFRLSADKIIMICFKL